MWKIATILAAIGLLLCAGGAGYAKTLAGSKSEQDGRHHRRAGTDAHDAGQHVRAGNGPGRHEAGIRHRNRHTESATGVAPHFAHHAHGRHVHHFGRRSHHLDSHSHHGAHHAHGAHPHRARPPLHRDHSHDRKHSRDRK